MYQKTVTCLLAGFLTHSAFATLATQDPTSATSSLIAPADIKNVLLPGIYMMNEDTDLLPRKLVMQGRVKDNQNITTAQIVTIEKGHPFALKFEGKKAYITPILPDNDIGKVPDTFIYLTEDLQDLPMVFMSEGDRTTLYSKFSAYVESQVAGACKALTERHLHFHVGGTCSTDVSDRMLAQQGFHRADCGSAELKLWNGGHPTKHHRGLCGHMAYKTRGGTWSSGDFVGDPGTGYSARGCYSRTGRSRVAEL